MNKVKYYTYDILAAFTSLTRIPIWRWVKIPKDHFRRVVYYWSVVGWVTGPLTALVILGLGQFLPIPAAVAFGFLFRIWLTGGMHEDGLMDFFDGFGGGRSMEQTLAIMKDSHSGSFAVIGFTGYAIIWIGLLSFLPLTTIFYTVMVGDPISKFVASNLPRLLKYARNEESAKMQLVYEDKPHRGLFIMAAHFGLLPISQWSPGGWWMFMISSITFLTLYFFMKRKINGYTGDCLGATFLLCEVMSYLAIWIFIV